jgi:hypothetical protein
MMSINDFKRKDWFPNFIILCKPISGDNEERGNTDNEYNGLIREM